MKEHQSSIFDFQNLLAPQEHPLLQLEALKERCVACNRCGLRAGCSQVVFADGDPHSPLMLIGEAPGAEEDRQGLPFVGAAGQLLNRILEAVGLKRESVYIANIVKCRPPGNRLPLSEEVKECFPYLETQIKLVNPKVIVCLGSLSARTFIDANLRITRERGRWRWFRERLVMPTFHPAALLRDSRKKRPVWEDFQEIAKKLAEVNVESRKVKPWKHPETALETQNQKSAGEGSRRQREKP